MTPEQLITELCTKLGISETQLRMQMAVDSGLVRSIVRDQRSSPVEPSGIVPAKPAPAEGPAKSATPGFVSDVPFGMPLGETGQRIIEQMVDASLPHGVKPKKV